MLDIDPIRAYRARWMNFADKGMLRYPNVYAELKAIYWPESALAEEVNVTEELIHAILWNKGGEDFNLDEALVVYRRFKFCDYGFYGMDYLFSNKLKCLQNDAPENQKEIGTLRSLYSDVRAKAEPFKSDLIGYHDIEQAEILLRLVDEPNGRITYAEYRHIGFDLEQTMARIGRLPIQAPRGLTQRQSKKQPHVQVGEKGRATV